MRCISLTFVLLSVLFLTAEAKDPGRSLWRSGPTKPRKRVGLPLDKEGDATKELETEKKETDDITEHNVTEHNATEHNATEHNATEHNATHHEGEESKHGEHHMECGEKEHFKPCSAEALEEQLEETAAERKGRATIVLGTACLFVMMFLGYLMHHHHIMWMPEAGVGILIGIGAGLVVDLFGASIKVHRQVQFDPDFFFIFLLPPIIFEAGYNMKRQPFFRNIGVICMFAFIGTAVSCFLVGGIVYFAGQMGLCHPLGGLASLVFGALISATDPVTVLAVFQALKADIDLYSMVFGESVLNDAVAIVLVRTLMTFKCDFSGLSVLAGLGSFLVIFLGSTFLGAFIAGFSAFVTKHTVMYRSEDYLFLETCMLCLYPYFAFMVAEAFGLSGIVSIMACGIVMSHYTYNNLSAACQVLSRQLFKVFAFLAESFVFIYLGFAVFIFPQTFDRIMLIVISFLAILFARLFNIFPNSFICNLTRKPVGKPGKISMKFQFVMWFSGLRGAVAFVLAVVAYDANWFPETNNPLAPDVTDSNCILTTTLFIAIITVFAMGGPVGYILDYFNCRESSAEEEAAAYQGGQLMGRGLSTPMEATGILFYDRKYAQPFLTRYHFDESERVGLSNPETLETGLIPDSDSPVDVELQPISEN